MTEIAAFSYAGCSNANWRGSAISLFLSLVTFTLVLPLMVRQLITRRCCPYRGVAVTSIAVAIGNGGTVVAVVAVAVMSAVLLLL